MANPTGQTIVTSALTYLGMVEQGGAPNQSDSNAALQNLNDMWDAMQIDEGLIFAVERVSETAIAFDFAGILVGPGQAFGFVPARIYSAQFFITAGSAGLTTNIRIVEAKEYYAHQDTDTAGVVPEE